MRNRDGLRAATISVTLSSLASAGALGVAAIIIARTLGPQGRGVFAASYSLLFLLAIAGSLGIGLGGRRLLALERGKGGAALQEYVAAAAGLVTLQIPIALFGAIVLLPIFDAGRSVAEQAAFVVCCVTTLASLLGREALYGIGAGPTSALILACGCLGTLAGVIVVAATDTANVASYLWVYAVAGGSELVAAAVVARRRSEAPSSVYRRGGAARVLLSGRAVLVLLIAQVAATRGDRLVIGALAGPSELGQYAVAASVMELLAMASFALGNVAFQGLASGAISQESMARARRLTVAGTALAAASLFVVAPWAIKLAFGSAFEAAVPTMRVLVLAAIPYGSLQINTQHLIARARSGRAAALAVGAAVSMVVGDILIVRNWGIEGAAWVTVFTYGLFAVLARLALRHH